MRPALRILAHKGPIAPPKSRRCGRGDIIVAEQDFAIPASHDLTCGGAPMIVVRR